MEMEKPESLTREERSIDDIKKGISAPKSRQFSAN
jgi:hypothetical protein